MKIPKMSFFHLGQNRSILFTVQGCRSETQLSIRINNNFATFLWGIQYEREGYLVKKKK